MLSEKTSGVVPINAKNVGNDNNITLHTHPYKSDESDESDEIENLK